MLERLLETGARPKQWGWGGTASVVVHGALIGIVIVRTGRAESRRVGGDPPYFIPIAAPVPDKAPGPVGAAPAGIATTRAANPVSTIAALGPIDIGIPEPISLGSVGADSAALADIGTRDGGGTTSIPGTGLANDNAVDTPVRVLDERVPPYPEALRSAGIAGSVTMQFVIDTLGRVEAGSIRTLTSSHDLFTRAVMASLRHARFSAGEVSGRRVRTLVERSFRFDISRAR